VNSLADAVANDGECTLREAVISSNMDTTSGASVGECIAGSSGEDSIVFSSLPANSTILLGTQLEIIEDLKINGLLH